LLLSLNPDDPLQRRDRGFLLHQLDCFKVAVDDYRYFVEQCPTDPAAQLLKIQLENITLTEPTFH
jgi:regulator of sirC expression with transglutaminase-like and TPR domain